MTTSHSRAWSAAKPYFEASLRQDKSQTSRATGEDDLRRVTTALGISAGNSNGCAFARSDGKSNFVAGFVDFNALNTGSDLVGFSGIMSVFVVDEIDIFQVMRPYA